MNQLPEPSQTALRIARPLVAIGMIALAGVGIVAGATWLGEQVGSTIETTDSGTRADIAPGRDVEVEVPLGSNAGDIAQILYEVGVIDSVAHFDAAVRSSGFRSSLQAGI